jgi:hypothetical protein
MHWMNVLIILGCLAAGYWLVSSIMGPGVDLTRPAKPTATRMPTAAEKPVAQISAPDAVRRAHDWHLVLDIPSNANRREIEHAYKRRLAQAESSGDPAEVERVRQAYAAASQKAGS